MPTFETPEPISVTFEFAVGTVRIAAGDRADTTVEVRPTDESDDSDVQAARQIGVEFVNGTVAVTGPRTPLFDFSRRTRSVDVSIALPSGSRVAGKVQVGDLHGTGRLGDCRFTTSVGDIAVEHTGALKVDTGTGHVTADGAAGNVEIHTGSGRVRIGTVGGIAVVKNSNGDTTIGAATGDVRVRSANGDIAVDRAGAGVEAKSSNGSIRLGEVVRGSVDIGTAMGDLEVGIAEGTAAWLEVKTGFGQVRNLLDEAAEPGASDETVEVHAHTSYGAITIRRS